MCFYVIYVFFYKQKSPFFIVTHSMATSRRRKSAGWTKAARAAKFRAAKAGNYPIDIVVTMQEQFFLTHKSHKNFSNNYFNHIFLFSENERALDEEWETEEEENNVSDEKERDRKKENKKKKERKKADEKKQDGRSESKKKEEKEEI